jgi:ribonuclease BN (tRNA processing enzyme)
MSDATPEATSDRASSDRLVLLGTGTCQLQEHRIASSALLELGDLRLVFDFGRGVATRLVSLGLRQDDVRHVVLSHFHPDHLSDLIPYLHAAAWSQIDPRREDLHVYGPIGLEVQLMRLLSLFGTDNLVRREHYRVHLHEVRGEELEVAGRRFDYGDLPPADNHGLKFTAAGRVCALTGDSFFHDREVAFLTGVDLAVIDSGHLSDEEIVELAVRSGAGWIVCSHLYRELDAGELEARAQKEGYTGRITVGRDRQSFDLGSLEVGPQDG